MYDPDPNDPLDTLFVLKEAVEQAKAAYELAKKLHERAHKRPREIAVVARDETLHHVMHLYKTSLDRYTEATVQYNRYLFEQKFTPEESSSGTSASG